MGGRGMSDPKPFASLSSGLLARKGAAKPAMRPQAFGQIGAMGIEDLGWNDMGYAPQAEPAPVYPIHRDPLPEHVPSSISALTPAPRSASEQPALQVQPEPAPVEVEAPASPVLEQQRAIEESFAEPHPVLAAEPVAEPEKPQAEIVPIQPRERQPRAPKAAASKGVKAAFTLRLEAERHLKLRLACAVTRRSAQGIVTEALDQYLSSLPELDAMARQAPAKLGKR